MGYVFYPTAHSKCSPLDKKVRVTGEIAIAPISELNVETLAHEYFKRLDKEFHLGSENFNIIYSDNSNVESAGTCNPAYPTIIIKQDALVSNDVFYTALRFEYANALAKKRIIESLTIKDAKSSINDEDAEDYLLNEYSEYFNEAMYELGCDVSALLNAKGHYFTDAVMCQQCGRLIHLSTSSNEALAWLNYVSNDFSCKCKARKTAGRNKEQNFCLIDGTTAYERFIETSKRIDNERASIKRNLYNAAKAQKLSEINVLKNEMNTLEKRLSTARSAQDVLLDKIDNPTGGSFIHKTLGLGNTIEIKDGRIYACFESGKTIALSVRALAQHNLISFTQDSIKNDILNQYSKLINEEQTLITDIETLSNAVSEVQKKDIAEYLKAIKEVKKEDRTKAQRDIFGICQNVSITGNSLSKDFKEVA